MYWFTFVTLKSKGYTVLRGPTEGHIDGSYNTYNRTLCTWDPLSFE